MSHKRPHEEFHDPDYPTAAAVHQPLEASAAKRAKPDNNDGSGSGTTTSHANASSGTSPATAAAAAAAARTPAETTELVRRIVRREFAAELGEREQELHCIEHRLLAAKRLLQRVRYAVVYSFYTNKRLVYTDSELRNELTVVSMAAGAAEETVVSGTQPPEHQQPPSAASTSHGWTTPDHAAAPPAAPQQAAVHPSLKKLLGTTTIDYNEILKVRPARQAAKDAKTSIAEKLRTKKDERRLRMAAAPAAHPLLTADHNTTTAAVEAVPSGAAAAPALKVPRYVSPIKSADAAQRIKQINTARGAMRNATRHLVAVGNTSMYIGDTGDASSSSASATASAAAAGGVTHKWLVYVQSKTARPVEDMVHKVRFFLHPSYKPNDVVDVSAAPFQIARRGWGEFPVRVQLFFHAHVQQKPLQIFHQLVLDQKRTGLQTMGAETVVEMWLNLAAVRDEQPPSAPKPAATTLANGGAASAAAAAVKAEPIVRKPATPKKPPDVPLPQRVARKPPVPTLEQMAVPDDIQLEETVLSSEPCWDPDGLIKSVQISEAEQSSLMAMAEESKRFGLQLLASPPHTSNGGQAPAVAAAAANGLATTNGTAWTPSTSRTHAAAAPPAPVTIKFAPVPTAIRPMVKREPADAVRKPTTSATASSVPAAAPAPAVIKSDPPNNVSISLAPNAPAPTTGAAPTASTAPVRKFVKCLNTAGKVVMVEVETDPNNPKNIRIVPKSGAAPTGAGGAGVQSAAASAAATQSKPAAVPNVAVPNTIVPPQVNSTPKPIAIGQPAPQRFVVLPKSTSHATPSAAPVKLLPAGGTLPLVRPAPAAAPAPAPAPAALSTLPNTRKVIMRNGQMFIIDTSKFVSRPIPQIAPTPTTASSSSNNSAAHSSVVPSKPASAPKMSSANAANPTVAKPKQQSLLKPQISLLKPKPAKAPTPNPATTLRPTTATTAQRSPLPLPLRAATNPAGTPTVVPLKFAMKLSINAGNGAVAAGAGSRTHTMPMPLIRRGFIRAPPPTKPLASAALLPTFQPRPGTQPQRIRIANVAALRPAAIVPTTHQHLHHHRRLTSIALPPERSLFNSAAAAAAASAAAARPRIDYRHDLEQRFLGRAAGLRTRRAAVEWLLRHVPQVHRLAGTNADFARAFPFITDRPQTFEAYVWPKQRSVEWLRAKYVGRLLAKWSLMQPDGGGGSGSGGSSSWTTKEIVLFARRFGYSLPIRPASADYTQTAPTPATATTTNGDPAHPSGSPAVALSTLIKREIKRGERTHDEPTFTLNARVQLWLDAWHARRNRRRRQPAAVLLDDDVIDVTGDGAGEAAARCGGGGGAPANAGRKPSRVLVNGVLKRRPKGLYPLPAALRTEAGWVSDVCAQVQVKLQPEEIVDGKMRGDCCCFGWKVGHLIYRARKYTIFPRFSICWPPILLF